MSNDENREIGETVTKEETDLNAVVDWRRDASWNTVEGLLGISRSDGPMGIVEALQQHAVLACVSVIMRDVSKCDVNLYRRMPGGGKERVDPKEHWLAGMLALDPNEEHSWSEFWQIVTIHLVLANNVFIAKRMNMRGEVSELIPVLPGQVEIMHNPSTLEKYYMVSRRTLFDQAMLKGMGTYMMPEQVIHVRNRIVDGLHGLPTLASGAPTMRLAKAINEYQKRLYDNDGQGRVAVSAEKDMKPLSDESFRRLKSEIRRAVKNMWSNGDALLMEPGYTAKVLAMTAADMKIAETHDSQITSVARVFGVPPHKIGHVADEKYSNMEVMERTYAHDVLIPIAKCFEAAIARSLLTRSERLEYFIEFDRRQMEIVDFKVRSDALKVGYERGGLTHDEWRREFGYNPLPNDAGKVRPFLSTLSALEYDSNEVVISSGNGSQMEPVDSPSEDDEPEEDAGEKGLRVVK